MDYRNSTIVVMDVADDAAAIWQVSTTRLGPADSPLTGAWVLGGDDRGQWDALTHARRCWATPEAAAFLSARGCQFGLALEPVQVRQQVLDHQLEVVDAFKANAEARPGLREPDWPTIPGPLNLAAGGPPGVGRALFVARWFAAMVGAWEDLEKYRTSKSRGYLHHLGGPNPLPLPLSPDESTMAYSNPAPIAADGPADPVLDFVAIDFETANSRRASPCAVGLVRFRDGEPVEEWFRLMRPPEGADHFDAYNTRIHGITASQVAAEPRFGAYWPQIQEFIGADPLVSHNAAFDLNVMRAALTLEGLEVPELAYTCTMRGARRSLDLLSYSLPWVCDALAVPHPNHHHPLDDARASGQVYVALALREDAAGGSHFLNPIKVPSPGQALPSAATDADPEHTLYGAHVVFTGGLDSMTRREAWQVLAALGGTPQQGVNRQTTIIVIGPDHYQGQVLAGDAMTGKMGKAALLREKGQAIEIMSEDEFLRCV